MQATSFTCKGDIKPVITTKMLIHDKQLKLNQHTLIPGIGHEYSTSIATTTPQIYITNQNIHISQIEEKIARTLN